MEHIGFAGFFNCRFRMFQLESIFDLKFNEGTKMEAEMLNLKEFIRDIPDFPKEGILFRDITPLLANADALNQTIEELAVQFNNDEVDCVAAIEARGFIFGSAVAKRLGVGFVPIRKKGKLPFKTAGVSYDLEYGCDQLEIHSDAFEKTGNRVLLIDDLLATGGTMSAACELVEKVGGVVKGLSFLIELSGLGGREKLKDYNINAVIQY